MPAKQLRNVCFTLNNYTDQEVQQIRDIADTTCDYLVFGFEKAETGTLHLQGYLELTKRLSFNKVRALMPRCHLESRQGTAQQASDYCKKDDQFEEFGTISNPGKRNDLHAFCDAIKADPKKRKIDIMEEFPMVYARYPKFVNEYRMLKQDATTLDYDETPNEWIWGPPGTGKSRPFQELPSIYTKMPNKWWDGYDGEDVVLIEDIEPDHSRLGHHIKIWADRYPFNAEFKGFSHKIRPPKIVITSNFPPDQIFYGQILAAILRRFKVTHKVAV